MLPQAAKPPEPTPPLIPKEDPYAFTLKQTVFIDLKALPKDVRSAVLVVSPGSPGMGDGVAGGQISYHGVTMEKVVVVWILPPVQVDPRVR